MDRCVLTDDRPYLRQDGNEILVKREPFVDVARSVLRKGVSLRFWVRGCSMSPFIRNGDLVTLSPLGSRLPGRGDVVAFISPGTERLVLHRLLKKKDGICFAMGDNMPAPDLPVSLENIMGRVTRVEREGKTSRLGLGPERFLIAWLDSRRSSPLIALARRLFRPLLQRLLV